MKTPERNRLSTPDELSSKQVDARELEEGNNLTKELLDNLRLRFSIAEL